MTFIVLCVSVVILAIVFFLIRRTEATGRERREASIHATYLITDQVMYHYEQRRAVLAGILSEEQIRHLCNELFPFSLDTSRKNRAAYELTLLLDRIYKQLNEGAFDEEDQPTDPVYTDDPFAAEEDGGDGFNRTAEQAAGRDSESEAAGCD